jgi:ABC-type lipoprotein export system ATPase subunit
MARSALRLTAPARKGRRSLANDPPLILSDEPTGNLDSQGSEQTFAVLERLVR